MDLVWIKLILVIQVVSVVEGRGFIETNFIEFENFEGRRFDGKCCDANNYWWSSDKKCSDECDHNFVLCMGNATDSSSMSACEFGKKELDAVGGNKITFNGNVGDFDNPVKFPFKQWPGVLKLKIDVQDQDDDEYDFVDHYEYQYNTVDLGRELEAKPKSLVLTGTRTRFNMELKVFCDINHYGTDCGTFCEETDDHTGHYRCDPATGDKICMSGWTGSECLTNIDDCEGNGCSYGSTCVDGINSYTCRCPPGRTGHTCHAEINECASRPCQNGGRCKDATNSFRCVCRPGFVGLTCQIELDECVSGPCQNGGECTDGLASFTCSCPAGFEGDRCEIDVNECEFSPCVQAEQCVDLPGDFRCECFPGFTGKICEVNIDECLSNPCLNDGVCIEGINSYTCDCKFGFTGPDCGEGVDFCNPNYCDNGATCSSTSSGFVCECPNAFTGMWCEMDLNECEVNPNICGENGRCINLVGNFLCDCYDGYEGRNCEIEIDECIETPCFNGGTCIDKIGKYECECPQGYTGETCNIDIFECESSPCVNSGVCMDTINGYVCKCPIGYTGVHCEIQSTTSASTTSSNTPLLTSTTSSYVTIDDFETSTHPFSIPLLEDFTDEHHEKSTIQTGYTSYDILSDKTDFATDSTSGLDVTAETEITTEYVRLFTTNQQLLSSHKREIASGTISTEESVTFSDDFDTATVDFTSDREKQSSEFTQKQTKVSTEKYDDDAITALEMTVLSTDADLQTLSTQPIPENTEDVLVDFAHTDEYTMEATSSITASTLVNITDSNTTSSTVSQQDVRWETITDGLDTSSDIGVASGLSPWERDTALISGSGVDKDVSEPTVQTDDVISSGSGEKETFLLINKSSDKPSLKMNQSEKPSIIWEESSGQVTGDSKDGLINYKEFKLISTSGDLPIPDETFESSGFKLGDGSDEKHFIDSVETGSGLDKFEMSGSGSTASGSGEIDSDISGSGLVDEQSFSPGQSGFDEVDSDINGSGLVDEQSFVSRQAGSGVDVSDISSSGLIDEQSFVSGQAGSGIVESDISGSGLVDEQSFVSGQARSGVVDSDISGSGLVVEQSFASGQAGSGVVDSDISGSGLVDDKSFVSWQAGSGVAESDISGNGLVDEQSFASWQAGSGVDESDISGSGLVDEQSFASGQAGSGVDESDISGSGLVDEQSFASGQASSEVIDSDISGSGLVDEQSFSPGQAWSGVFDSDISGSGLVVEQSFAYGEISSGVVDFDISSSGLVGEQSFASGQVGSGVVESDISGSGLVVEQSFASGQAGSGVVESDISGSGLADEQSFVSGQDGSGTVESDIGGSGLVDEQSFASGQAGSGEVDSDISDSGLIVEQSFAYGEISSGVVDSEISSSGLVDEQSFASGQAGSGVVDSDISGSGLVVEQSFASGQAGSGVVESDISGSGLVDEQSFVSGQAGSGSVESDISGSGLVVEQLIASGQAMSGVVDSDISGSGLVVEQLFASGQAGSGVVDSDISGSGLVVEQSFAYGEISSGVVDSDISSSGLVDEQSFASGQAGSGVVDSDISGSGLVVEQSFAYGEISSGVVDSDISSSGLVDEQSFASGQAGSGVVESDISGSGIVDEQSFVSGQAGSGVVDSGISGSGLVVEQSGEVFGDISGSGLVVEQSFASGQAGSGVVESDISGSGLVDEQSFASGQAGSGSVESDIDGSGLVVEQSFASGQAGSGVEESDISGSGLVDEQSFASGQAGSGSVESDIDGSGLVVEQSFASGQAGSGVVESDISGSGLVDEQSFASGQAGSGSVESDIDGSGLVVEQSFASGQAGSGVEESDISGSVVVVEQSFASGQAGSGVVESDISGSGLVDEQSFASGQAGSGSVESDIDGSGLVVEQSFASGQAESGVVDSDISGSGFVDEQSFVSGQVGSRLVDSDISSSGFVDEKSFASEQAGSGEVDSDTSSSGLVDEQVFDSEKTSSGEVGNDRSSSGMSEEQSFLSWQSGSGVVDSDISGSGLVDEQSFDSGQSGSGEVDSDISDSGLVDEQSFDSGKSGSGEVDNEISGSGLVDEQSFASGQTGSRLEKSKIIDSQAVSEQSFDSVQIGSGVVDNNISGSGLGEGQWIDTGYSGLGAVSSGIEPVLITDWIEASGIYSGDNGAKNVHYTEYMFASSGDVEGVTEQSRATERVFESKLSKLLTQESLEIISGDEKLFVSSSLLPFEKEQTYPTYSTNKKQTSEDDNTEANTFEPVDTLSSEGSGTVLSTDNTFMSRIHTSKLNDSVGYLEGMFTETTYSKLLWEKYSPTSSRDNQSEIGGFGKTSKASTEYTDSYSHIGVATDVTYTELELNNVTETSSIMSSLISTHKTHDRNTSEAIDKFPNITGRVIDEIKTSTAMVETFETDVDSSTNSFHPTTMPDKVVIGVNHSSPASGMRTVTESIARKTDTNVSISPDIDRISKKDKLMFSKRDDKFSSYADIKTTMRTTWKSNESLVSEDANEKPFNPWLAAKKHVQQPDSFDDSKTIYKPRNPWLDARIYLSKKLKKKKFKNRTKKVTSRSTVNTGTFITTQIDQSVTHETTEQVKTVTDGYQDPNHTSVILSTKQPTTESTMSLLFTINKTYSPIKDTAAKRIENETTIKPEISVINITRRYEMQTANVQQENENQTKSAKPSKEHARSHDDKNILHHSTEKSQQSDSEDSFTTQLSKLFGTLYQTTTPTGSIYQSEESVSTRPIENKTYSSAFSQHLGYTSLKTPAILKITDKQTGLFQSSQTETRTFMAENETTTTPQTETAEKRELTTHPYIQNGTVIWNGVSLASGRHLIDQYNTVDSNTHSVTNSILPQTQGKQDDSLVDGDITTEMSNGSFVSSDLPERKQDTNKTISRTVELQFTTDLPTVGPRITQEHVSITSVPATTVSINTRLPTSSSKSMGFDIYKSLFTEQRLSYASTETVMKTLGITPTKSIERQTFVETRSPKETTGSLKSTQTFHDMIISTDIKSDKEINGRALTTESRYFSDITRRGTSEPSENWKSKDQLNLKTNQPVFSQDDRSVTLTGGTIDTKDHTLVDGEFTTKTSNGSHVSTDLPERKQDTYKTISRAVESKVTTDFPTVGPRITPEQVSITSVPATIVSISARLPTSSSKSMDFNIYKSLFTRSPKETTGSLKSTQTFHDMIISTDIKSDKEINGRALTTESRYFSDITRRGTSDPSENWKSKDHLHLKTNQPVFSQDDRSITLTGGTIDTKDHTLVDGEFTTKTSNGSRVSFDLHAIYNLTTALKTQTEYKSIANSAKTSLQPQSTDTDFTKVSETTVPTPKTDSMDDSLITIDSMADRKRPMKTPTFETTYIPLTTTDMVRSSSQDTTHVTDDASLNSNSSEQMTLKQTSPKNFNISKIETHRSSLEVTTDRTKHTSVERSAPTHINIVSTTKTSKGQQFYEDLSAVSQTFTSPESTESLPKTEIRDDRVSSVRPSSNRYTRTHVSTPATETESDKQALTTLSQDITHTTVGAPLMKESSQLVPVKDGSTLHMRTAERSTQTDLMEKMETTDTAKTVLYTSTVGDKVLTSARMSSMPSMKTTLHQITSSDVTGIGTITHVHDISAKHNTPRISQTPEPFQTSASSDYTKTDLPKSENITTDQYSLKTTVAHSTTNAMTKSISPESVDLTTLSEWESLSTRHDPFEETATTVQSATKRAKQSMRTVSDNLKLSTSATEDRGLSTDFTDSSVARTITTRDDRSDVKYKSTDGIPLSVSSKRFSSDISTNQITSTISTIDADSTKLVDVTSVEHSDSTSKAYVFADSSSEKYKNSEFTETELSINTKGVTEDTTKIVFLDKLTDRTTVSKIKQQAAPETSNPFLTVRENTTFKDVIIAPISEEFDKEDIFLLDRVRIISETTASPQTSGIDLNGFTTDQYSKEHDLPSTANYSNVTGFKVREERTTTRLEYKQENMTEKIIITEMDTVGDTERTTGFKASITSTIGEESTTKPSVLRETTPKTEFETTQLHASTYVAFQDMLTQSKELLPSSLESLTTASTHSTSGNIWTPIDDKVVDIKQSTPTITTLSILKGTEPLQISGSYSVKPEHRTHKKHSTVLTGKDTDPSHTITSFETSALPTLEISEKYTFHRTTSKSKPTINMAQTNEKTHYISGTILSSPTGQTQTDLPSDKPLTTFLKEFTTTTEPVQTKDVKSNYSSTTLPKPTVSLGDILIKMSRGTQQGSKLFTTRIGVKSSTTTVSNGTQTLPIVSTYPTVTYKRSFIRHRIDLTSNNTYPHPRKEIYEYDRNTTLAKGKARLTIKRIRVTVIRTVSSAIEAGKKVVLQTYQRVKNITTRIRVATYDRSRQLLKLALDRVEALFKYCEDGINHFVVKPLLDTKEFVKERFSNAYVRLGEVFRRGKLIFKSTAEDVREETQTYFQTLANYYTGVYRQYSEEVRDIFESLKIPDP